MCWSSQRWVSVGLPFGRIRVSGPSFLVEAVGESSKGGDFFGKYGERFTNKTEDVMMKLRGTDAAPKAAARGWKIIRDFCAVSPSNGDNAYVGSKSLLKMSQ